MVGERRKRSRGSEAAYRDGGEERSSSVQKLLDRAPQFGVLANAASRRATELSASQKEFMDDFSARLAARLAEGDDASQQAADPQPAGRRTRPKEGRR